MNVDEAGRDGEAGGVDGARGGASGQAAHGRDLALPDGEVADEGGVAGAVDDAAAADQEVEILGRRRPAQEAGADRISYGECISHPSRQSIPTVT